MTEPIRLGYHGSRELVWDIVLAAGHDKEDIDLIEYPVADPFGPLRRGEQDAIIAKFTVAEPDLVTGKILGGDPRAAVLARDHPLAGRDSISIEELAGAESFTAPGGMPDYVWDDVVPPKTPGGAPIHRVHDFTTVAELLSLIVDAGAVHLSLLSIAEVTPESVVVVPVHDLPPAPVFLGWRSNHAYPEHVRAFIGSLS